MADDERPHKAQKTEHSPNDEIGTNSESMEPCHQIPESTREGSKDSEHELLTTCSRDTKSEHLIDDTLPPHRSVDPDQAPAETEVNGEADIPPTLSKNQQKKLLRRQKWDERQDERRAKRRVKAKERKERKRTAKQQASARVDTESPAAATSARRKSSVQLPITIIIDCGFDDLMIEKELVSLASQLTRAYSDNKNSALQTHLAISSFGGQLKDRFDTVMAEHHKSWRKVHFSSEDFVQVAAQAREWMNDVGNNRLEGALKGHRADAPTSEGEVVYLSSDSDVTLTDLKPYSTYIVGGLVDRNRHKGVCHRRACDRGVKTARLPIGDFLQLSTRKVLTTNHVVEIMLRWLELGDWGEAFMRVLPKRKGGQLKQQPDMPAGPSQEADEVESHSDEEGNNVEESRASPSLALDRSRSPAAGVEKASLEVGVPSGGIT